MTSTKNIGGSTGIYTVGGKCFLSHYGIQGQKWGVRRYQNSDGTLTSAGRERYGYDRVKNVAADLAFKAGKKIAQRVKKAVDNRRIKKAYGKGAAENMKREPSNTKRLSDLSDEEIQKRIDRLHLENQLLSEIKTKNQTALDMSNARKNRVTWYSRFGHDLVKTIIDKYANSNVLASKIKAEIDMQQKNYAVDATQATAVYKQNNVDATTKYAVDHGVNPNNLPQTQNTDQKKKKKK